MHELSSNPAVMAQVMVPLLCGIDVSRDNLTVLLHQLLTISWIQLLLYIRRRTHRNRRARNVVIYGLAPSDYPTEIALVDLLFNMEFDLRLDIRPKSVRRLGRPTNNTDSSNRVQPILVTLALAEDAAYLFANARKLRESENDDVRNSVYLNADLTRAQAQAAYEIRRRVNGQRGIMFLNSSARRGRADLNDDNRLTAPDSMETQSTDAGAAVALDASSAAAAAAGCNANAPTFVPSSVPSSMPSTAVHVGRPADVTVPDAVSASGGGGRH